VEPKTAPSHDPMPPTGTVRADGSLPLEAKIGPGFAAESPAGPPSVRDWLGSKLDRLGPSPRQIGRRERERSL
jgi:hypothetical protein